MAERQLVINGSRIRVRYSEMQQEAEEKLISKVVSMAMDEEKEKKVVDDKLLATAVRDYLSKTDEFGGAESSAWHVIVGQHFVCSSKYDSKSLIFFDIVDFHKSVLAFKSG